MAVNLQDLQTQDDAYAKQVADQQAAQKTKENLQPGQDQQQPSFISKFMSTTGRVASDTLDWAVNSADSINTWRDRAAHDVGAGLVTGATNIADAAGSAASSSGKGLAAAEDPDHADAAEEGSLPTSPLWDHAKSTILDFRDAISVKDPMLADNVLQAGAQLAVPFAGYSRMLSGVHGFANMVGAGVFTDATALGPHDARMADLIALGRHTEGKFGDALHALTPDGSAQNAYINYLADRGDETEAEGRFKNVLDGFGANMAVPLLTTAGSVLKQGSAGLRYAIENGVGSVGSMVPANQKGMIGYHGSRQAGLEKFDPEALVKDERRALFGHGLYVADAEDVAKPYAASQSALYKVEVPDEHVANMLDWDKPLAEQPREVQKAIKDSKIATGPSVTGADIMEGLGKTPETSAMLNRIGIKGVRYPASGKYSQGGSPSRVSVLFDPSEARIVRPGQERMDMSLSKEERAAERERIAAARDREAGVDNVYVPEPIPRRAAEHEGVVAQRMGRN